MKNVKKLALSLSLVCLTAGAAFACTDEQKVQAYAHPTMFGSQSQQLSNADANYIVGGKIVKTKKQIGMTNKENVLTNAFVKDVLSIIKENSKEVFNPKMPILRSELAVVLAEGLSIPETGKKYSYTDIGGDYWATNWIYKALSEGVMIGYPDRTFRPDQPITKAEVFATVATLIDVTPAKSLTFKGETVQYIPNWAAPATKEVIASGLLDNVPDKDKVINDEYLSKEQVAYLVGELRTRLLNKNTLGVNGKYVPTALNIKLKERISARHSNVGETFTAKLTNPVTINGVTYSTKAKVKGEVVEVSRPGVNNPGYVKVKFTQLKEGDNVVEFPKNISEAQADVLKNPNIIARLVGAPLSFAGRTVGIVGRSGASAVEVSGNGLENLGDNLSNSAVNTLSLHPGVGVKNLGQGVATVGKGVYDITKLAVSGTFGLVYEFVDELVYIILPSKSNNSSLNPGEELTIVY
ncbi:S-layer homology domain-containing protein [bacterium]|nr:S-layer homology domain-containing protein [bacterium]